MDEKMKRKSEDTRPLGASVISKGNRQARYFNDPRLISRIEQYLEDNRHLKKVNLNLMVSHLRKQYNEYSRKKQTPFRISVEKAYKWIVQELQTHDDKKEDMSNSAFVKRRKKEEGSDSDSSISESLDSKSFSSDVEKYVEYKNHNAMNNTLSSIYRKTPLKKSTENETTDGQEMFFIDKTGNIPCKPKEIGTLTDTPSVPDSSVVEPVMKTPAQSNPAEYDKTPRKSVKKKMVSEKKKEEKKPLVQKSPVTFSDVGGNEKTLNEICKLLVHMKHAEVYTKLGVTPPRGFLLHGPPGCGKSLMACAIAGELDLPLIKLAATEIVSGVSGESEEKLREIFTQAISCAPCILFLDEIDAITPKRENASKDMERRIVSQLLMCMDDLSNDAQAHVLVIGATNRPDSLDPALRRAGRFDREISLGIPDENAREKILRVLCRKLRLEENFDFRELSRNTPGYVGADLNSLTREAAMIAVNRILENLQKTSDQELIQDKISNDGDQEDRSVYSIMAWLKDKPPLSDQQLADLFITCEDFKTALVHVQPSAKREGFATIPDVTWDDIGALADVRDELQLAVLAPVRHREQFELLGLKNPPGILLAGPPGCGKTLLAKAIANESGINFISVKGPELLNMYVGESERAVRQVFQRARNSAPCVIFFDELDALCPKRSQNAESSSSARVVNQLLTEMDGLEERKQVFIMAATNRPDIIDPAVLRPGRLDKILYVGLPSNEDRCDILKTITKNGSKPSLKDVCLNSLATDERCNGYSGADLAALVREASVVALKEFIGGAVTSDLSVRREHFETAFGKVRPSVSGKDQLYYANMRERLAFCNK